MKESVLNVETRRLASKRRLLVFLFVSFICIYFVLTSIQNYKLVLTNSEEFQKTESYLENQHFRKYIHLSKQGLCILFIPSVSSIFFKSPNENFELTARINSITVIDIHNNRKIGSAGTSAFPIHLSFSTIILIIFSSISLYLAFNVAREYEYFSTLSSLKTRPPGSMVIPVLLIRFVFIVAAFLVILGCMVGLVLLFGIKITTQDIVGLVIYSISTCLVILACMFAGAIVGKIPRKSTALFILLIVWLGLVFGLPLLSRVLSNAIAVDVISTYSVLKKKQEIVNGFEMRVEKKYGKFQRNNIENERRIINDYMDNEYKEIENMESQIRKQMAENVSTYNMISIFNPVSFYFQTASAAGSCSDENVLSFYKYSQTMKRKLLEFIVERTYYNDPKIMVPFVKGDENLFYAKSHLPPNFGWGLLFNLFLVLVLAVITHFIYRNGPKHVKNNTIPRINPNTELSNLRCDRFGAVYVTNNRIRDFLFKLFCGKMPETVRPTNWSIKIDDVDIFSKELQGDFFYICRPNDIPGDIKVKTFLSFFASQGNLSASERSAVMDSSVIKPLLNKSFDQLKESERFEVMLSLTGLVKRKMYLVDDIMGELDRRYALQLFDRMKTISEGGSYVLYLTSKIEAPSKMESFSDDVDFATGKPWYYDMTSRWLVSKQKD